MCEYILQRVWINIFGSSYNWFQDFIFLDVERYGEKARWEKLGLWEAKER
jgi:hypothetical protein